MNEIFTQKQKEYFENASCRYNFAIGAVRSGKSYGSLFVIPKLIMRMKTLDGLVVVLGNTRGTLQRNIIKPLQEVWGSLLVSDINSHNISKMFGETAYCLGANNIKQVNQLRGMSIKICIGDEVPTWEQEVWEMLKSRLDKPYSRFHGTGNPDIPTSHIKKFIDNKDDANDIYSQHYTIYDNPFLDPAVVRDLENSYPKGSVWYRRLILGEWVRAEGLIYSNFIHSNKDDGGHIVRSEQIPYGNEYVISVDYGTSNKTSAGLWRIVQGVAYRIKEYVYEGKTQGQIDDKEHTDNIINLAKSVDGVYPNAQVIIDPNAASLITSMRKYSGMQILGADNSVIEGIRNTFSLISNNRIFIQEDCINILQELETYSWDDKSHEERPLKENDHSVDDFRYFCRTYMMRYYPYLI